MGLILINTNAQVIDLYVTHASAGYFRCVMVEMCNTALLI